MKRFKGAIACGLAVVVLVVIAGCSGNSSTDTPTTRTATVTRGNLTLDIAAAGNLAFSQTDDLPFDLFYQQGTVSDVLVQVGDSVTKGQELVTLDPDEWQTNLTSLQDAVTSAQRLVATRQQAVDSANRTVATKQQAVTNATNALAADQAQITAKQLAVTQAEYDVTSANNTINNLLDIKAVLDKIDEANQTIATATMILNSSTVYGVSITIADRTYFLNLISGSNSFLAEMNAKLKSLLNGTTPMSTDQAQFQLQQDQLTLQSKQLALSNAQAAVTQAQQAMAADQTTIEYANQDVATAQQNVTFASQDLASAQDAYDTAVQNLQDARAMSPILTAPFDGVITKVNVAGGDKVVRGTVAVEIADPARFEANILVSELDILQVKVGDTATVTADAVTGGAFPATVTQISPTATIQSGVVNYGVTVELQALTPIVSGGPSSGNVTASGNTTGLSARLQQAVDSGQMTEEQAQQLQQRIESGNFTIGGAPSSGTGTPRGTFTPPAGGFSGGGFSGGGFGGFGGSSTGGTGQTQSQLPQSVVTDYQLRQGLTVTVSISIAERSDVLLVPNAAVTTSAGKSYVQLVNTSGQVTQTEVQTGLNDWQNTEITSGLNEGEKVIVPLNTGPASSSSSGLRGGGGILGLGR
jgi:HlyD family secretion protein